MILTVDTTEHSGKMNTHALLLELFELLGLTVFLLQTYAEWVFQPRQQTFSPGALPTERGGKKR